MQQLGNVRVEEMFRTFNMGIGMVVFCDEKDSSKILDSIPGSTIIGSVIDGNGKVEIV